MSVAIGNDAWRLGSGWYTVVGMYYTSYYFLFAEDYFILLKKSGDVNKFYYPDELAPPLNEKVWSELWPNE